MRRVQTPEELERLSRIQMVVAFANSAACGADHPFYREIREYIRERDWNSERLALGEDE